MANQKSLLGRLFEESIHIIERRIASELETNAYTDTLTNIVAFGLNGGALDGTKCREWIFAETPQGIGLIGTRTYSTKSGEGPLKYSGEVAFADNGQIRGYRSGRVGAADPAATYDNDAELLGLLRGITGGILPGKRGDVEEHELRDLKKLREMAVRVASDHYFEMGSTPSTRKDIGVDRFGRKLYTVQIPVPEGPFKVLDPTAYDTSLIGKYIKLGSCYLALGPLYGPMVRVLKRMGFEIDPLINAQIETAYEFAQTGIGDVALAAYPAMAALYSGLKLGREHILDGWKFNNPPV